MDGPELRERRKALGLSQHKLAAALGVPWNTLARWERGELTIERPTLLHLAIRALEAQRGHEAGEMEYPQGKSYDELVQDFAQLHRQLTEEGIAPYVVAPNGDGTYRACKYIQGVEVVLGVGGHALTENEALHRANTMNTAHLEVERKHRCEAV